MALYGIKTERINMKIQYKKITFNLDTELAIRLKELSAKSGASQTFLIKKAIKALLEGGK